MGNVLPYNAIPFVEWPPDYQHHLAPLLAQAYQQHGSIFRATYLEQEIVFLVGPEANRFVLVSNSHKFSNFVGWGTIFTTAKVFGRSILAMDGDEHNYYRKIINQAFTISYMDRYVPLMNRIIRKRTQSWPAADEVHLFKEARQITFDIAAQALMGLEEGDEIECFRTLFVNMARLPIIATSQEDFDARLEALHREMCALLLPKIEERRKQPTDDIFGMLVQAHNKHGHVISDEQLIPHINIVLIAGHESSTSLSTWLCYLLNQHPDYTQRVLQEQEAILGPRSEPTLEDLKCMKILDHALSEAERLYPPLANGPRGVVEDFEFNGYHVPAGSKVFYSVLGSHMMPGIFAHPDIFDPDRFASPREEDKQCPYSLVVSAVVHTSVSA
jgi:cytochrome P450